ATRSCAADRRGEMRIRFADGRRTVLTYCTNVHPIEGLEEALSALGRYCRPVRERLGAPVLSLGLWLSARSAGALTRSADERRRLRDALAANGLELVTLNGFPYGDFHAERVKEAVYRPDWTDVRRYEYTLELAHILSECLPADVEEGTISTLPLADSAGADAETVEECATRLAHLAVDLDRLAQHGGRPIRVCLEPEPECLVETSEQAIRFFHDRLVPAARRRGVGREVIDRHLGLCFDACHQAVQFEAPSASWKRIADAGIRVGKVQLSCALEAPAAKAAELLLPFDEPRFLHQVRAKDGGRWRDLPAAIAEAPDRESDLRVHFHVPIHWSPDATGLRTTSGELVGLLAPVSSARPLPHLEVETYTWGVLPEGLRPRDDATLIDGIARELRFAESALERHGASRA
ncbi:MAG: metabolite traffic protein EboE, partial [Candidatus Binatia bacterium]